MPETLRGLGVSPGTVAGPALRMGRPPRLPGPRPVTDPDGRGRLAQAASAKAALAQLAGELAERAVSAADPAARAILEAQSLIAADPTLGECVAAKIADGSDAPHAVHAAFTEQAEMLREAGGYLGERAADLEDLRDRAVAGLLGLPMPGIPEPGYPYILVADDLAPADTAMLDPAVVLALVTAHGGPTSHTAILARGLGLPAVVGCAGAAGIQDRALVQVDGDRGTVVVGLSAEDVAEVESRREAVVRSGAVGVGAGAGTGAAGSGSGSGLGPGQTADGHLVPLLLNIGSAADLRSEAAAHGEGVGLLRTELLFLGRRDAPGSAEQRAAYAAVFQALPGKKIVVRTLDAGADKPLPFLALPEEPNPALGVRGLRTSRLRPELLELQLDAIAQAAGTAEADVWVMAPMVSTPQEAADFAALVRAHGLQSAGVMIEVPAAALRAGRILADVDFLSIGTNDLGQYTMAADRQNGELADLLDPWQPALLDLIADCGRAGAAAGKPVGVCGEAAADPLLAVVLAGLGISSLSMSARSIGAVARELGRHTLAECREMADLALAANGAVEARGAVASRVARAGAGAGVMV